ncbi:bile salt-activated lipase-like [Leptidea sinapis]|uniref:bile salt-activated lipase-like n=1 Tax=Leptidea sinapis TaxID=189913 RepID=UPI002133DD12|nr:bile salt-activated lipase-like [Leptidea sinapis]
MFWWLVLVIATAECSLVKIEQGLVQGIPAEDGDYTMFMGIPYAKVDMENPFGAAIPNPILDGIFLANDNTAMCPQEEVFNNTIAGSLDCLHINIYVPNTTAKLPVLVFIYGGSMVRGFASRFVYGPKFIVQHDVILVTFNYRLGPYGFMCLGTDKVPGNQGLKDQVLALRWIRDNIAAFGGDPDKITAFGQSAGARSVELHMLSRNEKLFHQAILQSGATTRYDLISAPDQKLPFKLAEYFGHKFKNVDEAVSFLSKKEPKEIIEANAALSEPSLVCFEDSSRMQSFITSPLNHGNDKIKTTPIISGYNNNEVLESHIHKTTEDFQNNNVFYEKLKVYNFPNLDKLVKIMRRYYIGDEKMTRKVRWEIIDFDSDLSYAYPVQRSIDKFLEYSESVLFHYIFSYNGNRNFVKYRANITEGGAAHGDDLGYLFDMVFFDSNPIGDDKLVLERMTTMWTNFAKYGDPTPTTSELLPVRWRAAQRDALHCLQIDSTLSSCKRPNHRPHALWDLLYKLLQ